MRFDDSVYKVDRNVHRTRTISTTSSVQQQQQQQEREREQELVSRNIVLRLAVNNINMDSVFRVNLSFKAFFTNAKTSYIC